MVHVAIGLVVAAVLGGGALLHGQLIGSAGAETYGHAWVQYEAMHAWPGLRAEPVIDPLPTWIVAGLARAIGPVAAWNAYAMAGIVLAAVGGGALAKAVGGRGEVGAVGAACMPIFLGSLTSGLTEDWMLGLMALAIAEAVRGRWVRAGLWLGVTAWCGLYLAWLGAAAVGCVIAWKRDRRAWRAVVLAALLGGGAAVPFAGRLSGEGHRSGTHVVREEPLWKLSPWKGADLAAFVTPGKVDTGGAIVREHPVYLGFSTLVLAGAHPAMAGVAACVAVAAGDQLSFAGKPLGIANPVAAAFRWLPLADSFNHLARVMLLGQLVLVALASRGWRWGWVLIAAETAFLSPARVPLPGTPAETPAIYAALATFPPGPVVVVGERHPQKPFYDQRAHGRELAMDPNRPGARPQGAIVVAFGDAVGRIRAERGEPEVEMEGGAVWATLP